jgi:hypothetical protein
MRSSSDTVSRTLHQHDATRPSAIIESGGIQKFLIQWCRRQCPSTTKYHRRDECRIRISKETQYHIKLAADRLAGLQVGCGRRAVEGAGSTRRAILSAHIRVSSYSGESMEVTSRTLLPLLCALSCNVNIIVYNY